MSLWKYLEHGTRKALAKVDKLKPDLDTLCDEKQRAEHERLVPLPTAGTGNGRSDVAATLSAFPPSLPSAQTQSQTQSHSQTQSQSQSQPTSRTADNSRGGGGGTGLSHSLEPVTTADRRTTSGRTVSSFRSSLTAAAGRPTSGDGSEKTMRAADPSAAPPSAAACESASSRPVDPFMADLLAAGLQPSLSATHTLANGGKPARQASTSPPGVAADVGAGGGGDADSQASSSTRSASKPGNASVVDSGDPIALQSTSPTGMEEAPAPARASSSTPSHATDLDAAESGTDGAATDPANPAATPSLFGNTFGRLGSGISSYWDDAPPVELKACAEFQHDTSAPSDSVLGSLLASHATGNPFEDEVVVAHPHDRATAQSVSPHSSKSPFPGDGNGPLSGRPDTVTGYVSDLSWACAPCVVGTRKSCARCGGRCLTVLKALPCTKSLTHKVVDWSQRATMTQKSVAVMMFCLGLAAVWYIGAFLLTTGKAVEELDGE